MYGDHDPSKHKLGMLNLVGYLPHDCIQLKDAEKSVWAEHSTLCKMSELNAKLCYIRFCHSLPTYGTHFTLVREKAEEKSKLVPCLLGISKNGIIIVDVKTRNVLTSWPLSYIKRWAFGSEIFVLVSHVFICEQNVMAFLTRTLATVGRNMRCKQMNQICLLTSLVGTLIG